MLYLLTGEIQTGKTRWLESLTARLEASGVPVAGVLAPGVWRRCPPGDSAADAHGFEKLGIDNVLLPEGVRVHLARRRDLVPSGALDASSQSERAGLGWAMSDGALETVDRHVARLEARANDSGRRPGLFVVDELGRLELLRGEGLVSAMRLLGEGPSLRWPHALAVVRRDLLAAAHRHFDDAWRGEVREVVPGDAAMRELCRLYEG